jgi:hypothetical protein
MEQVCRRNEISSLCTAESSFGSIVLVGSYCQSTFSTFFDVLSHHLPQKLPDAKRWELLEAAKLQRQANRSTIAESESTRSMQHEMCRRCFVIMSAVHSVVLLARAYPGASAQGNCELGFGRNQLTCKELGPFPFVHNFLQSFALP